jgi:hypothetical protein
VGGGATREQFSGEKNLLHLLASVGFRTSAVCPFLEYGAASLRDWCCIPEERVPYDA